MTPRTRGIALFLAALAACSDAAGSDDEVVALEVTAPPGGAVEVGDTVQYSAEALNRNGDPVPATIVWSTPDTANIWVDSTSGQVVGKKGATQGRVQARTQGLVSPLNVITVVAVPDTLILVPPDTVRVDSLPDSLSVALVARLESNNPVGPLANREIVYTVIEPLTLTVKLPNDALVDTVLTNASGEPTTPMTLARVTGVPSPDSAIVQIHATFHQGADTVPGSGQRWIVRFSN